MDPLKEFNSLYENIIALFNRDLVLYSPRLLFVWNISGEVTEAVLRNKFSDCGQINTIRLFPDVIWSSLQCALVNYTELTPFTPHGILAYAELILRERSGCLVFNAVDPLQYFL